MRHLSLGWGVRRFRVRCGNGLCEAGEGLGLVIGAKEG